MIVVIATIGKANMPIYMVVHRGNEYNRQVLAIATQIIKKLCKV
jgi:hypothetical protein